MGLARHLTDDELDTMFRVRSELDGQEFGDADAVSLMPLLRPIYDAHVQEALNEVPRVGGFVDVGANVGDVTASVLAFFSDHHRRFYRHLLTEPAAGPPLADHVHHLQGEEALAFACLTNLIFSLPQLRWYAMRDAAALGAWARLVDACLAASAPPAAASLSEHGITADLYLPAWILTLFARPLGVDAAAPLWDRCILGGAPEVLRCVLGLVRHLTPLLAAAGSFEGCLGILARPPACARGPLGVAAAVDGTPLPPEAAALLAELDAGAL